jgi:hypothetical protein
MTKIVPFEEDEDRPRVETLAVAEITQDEEIAARAEIDLDVVADYQERMAAGDEFPPLQVIRDDDGVNWLVEGWQRLEAARRNGLESIRCAIRKGDRRAALLASAAVNAQHGLRRSAADKRRAVLKLLNDPEWSRWSDREIARRCKVSNTFVGEVRSSIVTVNADSDSRLYRTKHGNVVPMNVTDIGAKPNTRLVSVERREWVEKIVSIGYRGETTTIPLGGPAEVLPAFGEREMSRLERLAGDARYARDKAFARRMEAAARKLVKAAERLRARKT